VDSVDVDAVVEVDVVGVDNVVVCKWFKAFCIIV
jgi:hypothetical protein